MDTIECLRFVVSVAREYRKAMDFGTKTSRLAKRADRLTVFSALAHFPVLFR